MQQPETTRLVDVLLDLGGGLHLGSILQRIVESACALVGARYGSLAVVDGHRDVPPAERFVSVGLDDATAARLSALPDGRGVFRAPDVSDRRSTGSPPDRRQTIAFVGATIRVGDQRFGSLHVADAIDGDEFTDEHQRVIHALAVAAGVTIQNARLTNEVGHRARWLDAAREITSTLLTGGDPGDVLLAVVRRARELVRADVATIAIADMAGRTLLVDVADSIHADDLRGVRYPVENSITGEVMRSRTSIVHADVSSDDRIEQPVVSMGDLGPAIFVPLVAGGRSIGALVAATRVGGHPFGDDDLRMLEPFAAQAAIALEYGRTQAELGRLALVEERERIGRDLHDSVIQRLFATGLSLQALVPPADGDPELSERIQEAIDELDATIREIRTSVFALHAERGGSGGVRERLLAVVAEASRGLGFRPRVTFDGAIDARLDDDTADSVVRILREALSNVARHAGATSASVTMMVNDDAHLTIEDDGVGFDPDRAPAGEGLRNMRERARELGGELLVTSPPTGGTSLRCRVPLPSGA